MGARRTHEQAAVAAARAAYVAGFDASSNLAARARYGVPSTGTAAHSFTLLHDAEADAFRAQVQTLGVGTTLLVDTYDVAEAVRLAVEVAGTGLGAVRLDSGDLGEVAREVRAQLDGLGASGTRIVVTSDLDEHAIAALAAAPVDAYGVGTQLVTGSGHPTCGFVYKLVAREDAGGEMVSVAKKWCRWRRSRRTSSPSAGASTPCAVVDRAGSRRPRSWGSAPRPRTTATTVRCSSRSCVTARSSAARRSRRPARATVRRSPSCPAR
jgi:putative nicotinate phosphoribosyltransferase